MPESSGRILADRSVIRLDGRPFFSFGPRVLLSPPEAFRSALQQIARAGFTVVGSPPCSPGNLPQINAFFDAAEETNLLVVLMADARLPEHGRYLADHFRHRPSLHSYLLSPRPATTEGLESYLREQDNLRARDLFHPIFLPLTPAHLAPRWLRAQDLYAPQAQPRDQSAGRIVHQRTGPAVRELQQNLAQAPPRPVLVTNLECFSSDESRRLGLYSEDPLVASFPPGPLDWYPYLAHFMQMPRRDLLDPPPEILRLQIYELLCEGARGALMNFYEALGGPSPHSGHDRFCEATIVAQEIALLRDFFAEGRIDPVELETGHPRLRASVLRHGMEQLIVLRIEGYEEDFFVDEAYMERTELEIHAEGDAPIHAWRVDFPEARRLDVVRESSGSVRFLAGPLELTGLILLSPGTQRCEQIATDLAERLPMVARQAIELLDVRYAKLSLIEGELQKIGGGVDNRDRMRMIDRGIGEAQTMLRRHDFAPAFEKARECGRLCRQVIKYQMAKALAAPVYERKSLRAALRSSYFTLPRFYREGAIETARAFTDLT